MDKLIAALSELKVEDLEYMADEFGRRTHHCLAAGQNGWSHVYAVLACAAVDALAEQ